MTEHEKRIRLLEGVVVQCRAVLRTAFRDYENREPIDEQALYVLKHKILLCDAVLDKGAAPTTPPPPPPGPPLRFIREGVCVIKPNKE